MKPALGGLLLLLSLSLPVQAADLAGVFVEDKITVANGETLILNGMGLREKLWIDVYVGSLYLSKASNNVADILAMNTALRIRIDSIYKEVSSEKLIDAWKKGFEKNQTPQKLAQLSEEIAQFYSFFAESSKKGDNFVIDYIPGRGTSVTKNGTLLGTIEGIDFKDALLEIWLGNYPVDKGLKKGMLGLN
ncbi:MAG: chalcone isomerase family protein [Gammaproteobacteria bacterium]|nr:chalcone isomerase family protein [Gammaproteobacteria bacterium]